MHEENTGGPHQLRNQNRADFFKKKKWQKASHFCINVCQNAPQTPWYNPMTPGSWNANHTHPGLMRRRGENKWPLKSLQTCNHISSGNNNKNLHNASWHRSRNIWQATMKSTWGCWFIIIPWMKLLPLNFHLFNVEYNTSWLHHINTTHLSKPPLYKLLTSRHICYEYII